MKDKSRDVESDSPLPTFEEEKRVEPWNRLASNSPQSWRKTPGFGLFASSEEGKDGLREGAAQSFDAISSIDEVQKTTPSRD